MKRKNLIASILCAAMAVSSAAVPAMADDASEASITYSDGKAVITSESGEAGVLVYAKYTDEVLDGIELYPVDPVNGSAEISIDASEGGKLMLWNSVEDMVPQCDAVDVEPEHADDGPIYLDTSYSYEERAADLVSRMTLEEKAAQLGYQAPAIERLGVHEYNYWMECLHGVARQGKATNYPAPLALSNTWNRELIYQIADETSTEARAKNNRYNLSYYTPTINLARDPRWGRNEETYGEDPYLTGQLGAEFVEGMQGDDEQYTKIIATIKHFAANNNERNRRGGSSLMSEYNFRNYYTKVFKNVTEQVMPGAVMSSYNATTITRNGEYLYNYKPSASNSYLLTDILRRNWGFDGYVTTDCGAGEDLVTNEQYRLGALGSADEPDEAYIAEALKSGMDLECNLSGGNRSTVLAADAVNNGYITEEELETVIYHLFLQRFKTGEFDEDAETYRGYTDADIESDEHVATAEEAAEESWVLLKNDNGILPLSDSVKKVAVVGDLADDLVLGDYTGTPEKTVTPIEGITEVLGAKGVEVRHVGAVDETTPLYNIKSISLVKEDGSRTELDLSQVQAVEGMNEDFTEVTPQLSAYIPNVDFENVVSVEIEMATGTMWGGSLNIAYGQGGPTVASVSSRHTEDSDTYVVCSGEYTGADGGYNGTRDMYISATAATREFSPEEFAAELDWADVIIAYTGTIPKQDGFGESDAAESNDREDIDIPAHQTHVQPLCDSEYADKTVVVMSTVGQMNVEPFKDKCAAILWTSYNGQTQGTALGRVLSGDVNPSGHLTTTWYANSDVEKLELVNNADQTIDGITGKYTDYDIQAEDGRPGNTYMYYTGTPVYPFGYGLSYTDFTYSGIRLDRDSVDANGSVTAEITVTNSGGRAGYEVVQMYAAHPGAGEGLMPKKQLQGFEKIYLEPGESRTVAFTLDMKDMYIFDEAAQKDIVPNGEYTIYIGKDSSDESNSARVNVSGTLESKLKTVKAMPDGVTLNGLIAEDGTELEAKTVIDPRVSAVMSDETVLKDFEVVLTSSDPEVAQIEDGKVVSGVRGGTATITASVTINGETKTDEFPIVNVLALRPTSAEISAAKEELASVYGAYPEAAYSEENYEELTGIYNAALAGCDEAESTDELNAIVAEAAAAMQAVELDALTESFKIASENENVLIDGVIDYREGGIPPYSGGSGTITNAAPYTVRLTANTADGDPVENAVWQLKRLDDSSRRAAEIDADTGELTIYGNGVIEVTAADLENLTCARQVIYINTQIEGEYADDSGGADLTDSQGGASNGLDVGSSRDSWIEYKGVKLEMLESVLIRYSSKSDAADINISLDKSTDADKLIAAGTVEPTGAWNNWSTAEFTVNGDVIRKAGLDDNGCATIYIQTNRANLDYFKLTHTQVNDEVPYLIEGARNLADGAMEVNIRFRGSLPLEGILTAEPEGGEPATLAVDGTGRYRINTGASDNISVELTVNDAEGMPLSETVTQVYITPVPSTIVVYSLDSEDHDYTVLTGGADREPYGVTVNGLSGYGSWTLENASSAPYTYTDVNGNKYTYSFDHAWKAGSGGTSNRSLFFTPAGEGKVTVLFNGAVGRDMYIEQNGNRVTGTAAGSDVAFSMEITDTENPVYVYGGSSNKNLYAIIVEYYGGRGGGSELAGEDTEPVDEDIVIQTVSWGGEDNIELTRNPATGETKVWQTIIGDQKIQLRTDVFEETYEGYRYGDTFTINSLAVYKDRIYAGCDDGIVIVFTTCSKCYQLKRVCGFDIKELTIEGGVMTVTDGVSTENIDMGDIGGDSIKAEEAMLLVSNGAVLIDVRDAEDYAAGHAEGSVNIPIDELDADALAAYDPDQTIIFTCYSGTRAAQAVRTAESLGYINVYNAGSVDDLV